MRHRERARALSVRARALFVGVLFLSACRADNGPPDVPASPQEEDAVVARFGDLELTAGQVDERILALPPSERPAPGADLESWYLETVRGMVVDAQLLAEARTGALSEDPAFDRARTEATKQFGLQICLAQLRPELQKTTAEELREFFDARREGSVAPERRLVYHLFLRRADAERAEIEALRDRLLRGESFPKLAKQYSQSESRHQGGALGWLTPGILPPELDAVVFNLTEGVPSEPVEGQDGFHLFYVDQVLPAYEPTFEEVLPQVQQRLVAERSAAAIAELEAEIQLPEDALVLDREAFAAVLANGAPETVVLRVGDTSLDLAGLRRTLGQHELARGTTKPTRPEASMVSEDVAWRILEDLRRRELIHHHCEATGKISEQILQERLSHWQERALLDFQRRRRMLDLAERDESRLRLFYDSNIGDFSSRPQWHVELLMIPLGDDPTGRVKRLEEAAVDQAGPPTTLAAEYDGEIEDLGFVDLPTLARRSAKLAGLVPSLGTGRISPPVRLDDRLMMIRVLENREATPLPFDENRRRVAAAYVDHYAQQIYDELSEEILGDGSTLEIDTEVLGRLHEAALPSSEVSAEELDALFEKL